MDIPQAVPLASMAVALIKSGLKSAGDAAAKKSAENLVEWIKSKASGDQNVQRAASKIVSNPSDESAAVELGRAVQRLADMDATLRLELQNLVSRSINIQQTAGSHSTQIGQITGNVNFGEK